MYNIVNAFFSTDSYEIWKLLYRATVVSEQKRDRYYQMCKLAAARYAVSKNTRVLLVLFSFKIISLPPSISVSCPRSLTEIERNTRRKEKVQNIVKTSFTVPICSVHLRLSFPLTIKFDILPGTEPTKDSLQEKNLLQKEKKIDLKPFWYSLVQIWQRREFWIALLTVRPRRRLQHLTAHNRYKISGRVTVAPWTLNCRQRVVLFKQW